MKMSTERRSQNNLLKRPALNGAGRRRFLSLRHIAHPADRNHYIPRKIKAYSLTAPVIAET